MSFGRRSPEIELKERLEPRLVAETEKAFDSIVSGKGGSLKGISEQEFQALRAQARALGRDKTFSEIDDPEWRYEKDTGRFRRRPLVTVALGIAGVLGAICGDILYEALKGGSLP
jgi:hypothetical protein